MGDSADRAATEEQGVDLPDEALEMIRQQRFRERVERVLEVMQRERIDWRGLPFIKPDGRIGVRVVPFDCHPAALEVNPQGKPAEGGLGQ